MSNRNYNLNLSAKAEGGGNEIDFDFDPYNDCTDMDGLKTLGAEKLNEEYSNGEDDDTVEEDDVVITITDYGEVPDKYANEKDVWDFAETFAECEQELEVVEAALECGVSAKDIDEAYNGEWKSDEDFVQNLLEDTGDLPQNLASYIHIDWERTARDIMMDYSEHNGYYFRNL